MNEIGDTFQINVLEEAAKTTKKSIIILVSKKISLLFAQQVTTRISAIFS